MDGLVQQRAVHKQLALPTMTFTPNVSPPPPECNVGVRLLVEEFRCRWQQAVSSFHVLLFSLALHYVSIIQS